MRIQYRTSNHHPVDERDHEPLLRPDVVDDARLRQAGRPGDRVEAHGLAVAEECSRMVEEVVPGRHGTSLEGIPTGR